MLVLSRKENEEVVIGNNVSIRILGVFGNRVRLGISAPDSIRIRRGELPERPFEMEFDVLESECEESGSLAIARPR